MGHFVRVRYAAVSAKQRESVGLPRFPCKHTPLALFLRDLGDSERDPPTGAPRTFLFFLEVTL